MGAPLSDLERHSRQTPHLRHIPRSFDLASTSVTVAEFQRFLKDRPDVTGEFTNRYSPVADGTAIGVTWYIAAHAP